MSIKRLFTENWEFVKTPFGTPFEELSVYENDFERVDIPHDWLIYDTLNLYETSTGWYRKHFSLKKENGKVYMLRFDGVYMDSKVYINGVLLGEWKYGYSTFEFDMTALLKDGSNTVMVRVDYHAPNSRWYSGAGIFRNVWLKEAPKEHLVSDGIYVVTKPCGEDFLLNIEAEVTGMQESSGTQTMTNPGAKAVLMQGKVRIKTIDLCFEPGTNLLAGSSIIEKPVVWDAEHPVLYHLRVTLFNGDREECNIGFRNFVFDPDQGFLANGRRVKLHGVCEHHDLGCLGAAFHEKAMVRKIATLKKMGVNAIRTSHNMPAPELMDLADQMGIYIVSEAFDMWMEPKTEYDYARFFDEWVEKDVASWIRRDRNHPSVIMWSIGNEIHDTHEPKGVELTKRLMEDVLLHDPQQNARVTIGSNYMPWQGAQNCADIVKMAGYNYGDNHYDTHHKEHPDWVIYGSETSSIVQSRGVYHFPLSEPILTEEDEQCSSLGNSRPSWAAKSVEHCICVDRDRDFAAGQFLWTGFDYIGEPTPYKTKNSYFGLIDTAGFPKDVFYMYQAEWTDYKKNPMVHVLPYWDFNEGQVIDIRVCSNAPEVEVFVNGKSLGKKVIDHAHGQELFPGFSVPFHKGSLRAVAYDEYDNVLAEDVHNSFGNTASLEIKPEFDRIAADGRDLAFVEISARDEDGNPVENAMDYVEVEVTGAGRLVGLDNGDSTDYDSYKGKCRKLFNGRLLAVIAAKDMPGEIIVTVRHLGTPGKIAPAMATLYAEETHVKYAVPVWENVDTPLITGKNLAVTGEPLVPVRKIELVTEAGQVFDANQKEIEVKAYLYPADVSVKEVTFSAVNDAGINSNLAEVTILPIKEEECLAASTPHRVLAAKCLVKAKGDGEFRLRATIDNGTGKVKLLSQLEFSVSGLGEAYLNPYGFIAGALYTDAKGDIGGFSEKSVATAQEGVSEIGYRGLDFGEFGSDEITLSIFAQSADPHYLQIFEGMPEEEGSEMLADVVYQKPSTWDVYKPETYKLKRRLKGITTLCLVAKDQRYFIKGFSFTVLQKAFEKIGALEYNNLYGDTYRITADSVEDIGNNVSMEYENMDFADEGVKAVTICGRTALTSNTIHIRFFKEDESFVNQIVEFPHSEEYTEVTFPLNKVTGMTKVGFIFLPGCRFDFKWFRFS